MHPNQECTKSPGHKTGGKKIETEVGGKVSKFRVCLIQNGYRNKQMNTHVNPPIYQGAYGGHECPGRVRLNELSPHPTRPTQKPMHKLHCQLHINVMLDNRFVSKAFSEPALPPVICDMTT